MAHTERTDPYKNFRFRVRFGHGTPYVLGVSKVSGLKRTTEVVEHRDGGDPGTSAKLPGRTSYEGITLERGITQDKEFAKWANKVWSYEHGHGLSTRKHNGTETSLKDFRRDITIDVFDEGGTKPVLSYIVYKCWVSEYQALPELDANANAVAIENIKIECESWEQDHSIDPPEAPQFDDPVS